MFGFSQSRCQVCGNTFNRARYKWQIHGKTAWVCPSCNATLEKRVSAAAFGKPVEFPDVRPPDGCLGRVGCGTTLLCVIGLTTVVSLINNRTTIQNLASQQKRSPARLEAEDRSTPPPSRSQITTHSRIPLFSDPSRAANVPILLGLTDTVPDGPSWRKGEVEWAALASVVTHHGNLERDGDVDNNISCLHTSTTQDRVESVRWRANIFDPTDHTTAARFKELCLSYLPHLGCQIPAGLFEKVNPEVGQRLETEEATFELERVGYRVGFGWQFIITAKP